MEKIIEVKNVSKTFGKNDNLNQVLDGASLKVEEGEFVSLWVRPVQVSPRSSTL